MTDREKRVLLRAVNRAVENGVAYPHSIRRVLRQPTSPMILRLLLNELVRERLLRVRVGSMLRVAYVVTERGRKLLVGDETTVAA